jgi:cell wall-associated NlpC family hydrolase
VSDRIRLALLVLVLVAFISARAGGALGATSHTDRASARQARVVTFARHLLGVRYTYGGTSPRSGFDCSGFTRFVFAHFGVALPHYSVAQFGLGRRVARRSLKPGDLVFFDGLGHVGIYVGRGRFIHAPHTGTRVSVEPLRGWYSARFVGARRVI